MTLAAYLLILLILRRRVIVAPLKQSMQSHTLQKKRCVEYNTFLPPYLRLFFIMNKQPAQTEECGIKVHIGSLISNELHRQHRPAAWLAHEICCDRTNVYKILRKGSVDTELLCRISMALNHDFFAEYQHACGFTNRASTSASDQ